MINVRFSSKALNIMANLGLSESQVLDAFNNGESSKWSNRKGFNSVKKYSGYEVGAAYFQTSDGNYIITSAWKRERR